MEGEGFALGHSGRGRWGQAERFCDWSHRWGEQCLCSGGFTGCLIWGERGNLLHS